MSLKQRFQEEFRKAQKDNRDGLQQMIEEQPKTVRYLLGLAYHHDAQVLRTAAWGLGVAARVHPDLIQEVIRRLVWAMNDESGTNALNAPKVLHRIGKSRPDLLLPMVPDLVRLAADPGLHEGLAQTLRLVSEAFPGQVGQRMGRALIGRKKRRRR